MLQHWAPKVKSDLGVLTERRTKWLRVAKFLLPAIALFMIGLVLFYSLTDKVDSGFRIDFSSIEQGEGDLPTMINPRFEGVDRQGQPFAILADRAVQVSEQTVALVNLDADMTVTPQGWYHLNAKKGWIDFERHLLGLEGGVHMLSDRGYEFYTENAMARIDDGLIYGDQPIEGSGPSGMLRADRFAIYNNEKRIRMEGNVRMLLYREE